MQIVIDIPDGYIGVVMANQRTEGTAMDKLLRQAVIDGAPLPKGHGRLIDVDKVIKIANKTKDLHGAIWNAPTIIEADKESEE